ncbi:hypothetical protein R1sor_026847 [Riccia sorocarpa]|uniref:Uncharacterized protein n=1 Tax=Riccia sorocarpa TaxID=122646 RepID=A0ABD3GGQ1_9MARC
MGPKKKKGKKKAKKKKEPKHDSGWKKTIENGKWERPLESLPSVDKWPTWGELREKMFAALKKSHSLEKLVLSRSFLLKKIILETKVLKELTVKSCPVLETLMIWSDEMTHLNIIECTELINLELYCPRLVNLEKGPLKVVILPPKPRPPVLWIMEQEDLRAPKPPPEFGYPDADKPDGLQSTRPIIPRTHLFGL